MVLAIVSLIILNMISLPITRWGYWYDIYIYLLSAYQAVDKKFQLSQALQFDFQIWFAVGCFHLIYCQSMMN